jgi:large subunit ribosomal protein L21
MEGSITFNELADTRALIDSGNNQLIVKPGRFYDTRHYYNRQSISYSQRAKLIMYRVLLIYHNRICLVGTPWVQNATVKIRLLHVRRDKKIIIYKMQSKKHTRSQNGHRQTLIRFVVDEVCLKLQHTNYPLNTKPMRSTRIKSNIVRWI